MKRRERKKGRMDYPSISIDKYRREKLSSECAARQVEFRYRYRSSVKPMRYRICTRTPTHTQPYIHTYTHAPTDGFSCEIAFAACEAGLSDGISFNDRFLRPWIALFADSKTLLLQQQPCDRVRAKQRTADSPSPIVTGNRRIRPILC